MSFWVYYICNSIMSFTWAQIFHCYFITNLWFSMCVMLSRLVPVFYGSAIIFTFFLFFLHTWTIFQRNPCIIAFFAGLWLAVLGRCLAFIFDVFDWVQVNPADILQGIITWWTSLLLVSLSWSMSHVYIAHRSFFPQDHLCHEYHISDYVILYFKPQRFSNSLHSSERHTDECHGLSGVQEYDTLIFLVITWHLSHSSYDIYTLSLERL